MTRLPDLGYARFITAFEGVAEAAGREISEEEGAMPLIPSSTIGLAEPV
jgi:hypothetical protein